MAEIARALMVRVGVDLAKNVIQVHGVDAQGRRVVAKAIKRDQFVAWCTQRNAERKNSGAKSAPFGQTTVRSLGCSLNDLK